MDKIYFDIAILVGKYLAENLTEEERKNLDEWLALSERNREWFRQVTSEKYQSKKLQAARSVRLDDGWQTMQKKRASIRTRRVWRQWCKYAAVFIVPVLVGWMLYQQFYTSQEKQVTASIVPKTSKAILVMADGEPIVLEQQQRQVLEELDGTKIDLRGEHIVYEKKSQETNRNLTYNKLVVPRGGEYSLTLSDGTVVYMNADSELRFPVNFAKSERVVELLGEAYFQVARNEAAPFIVKTSNLSVTVLGTEFNISAYAEDIVVQATLVKGSVRVTLEERGVNEILGPGEQASYNKESDLFRVDSVDVSCVTAWRNGGLRFREKPLSEIMKIIARWYDVEVVYEDEEVKNYPFGCNFSRHTTIEPLLAIFEATGTIDTQIDGRKIFIKKRK